MRKTEFRTVRVKGKQWGLHNGENRFDLIPVPLVKPTACWLNKHSVATLLILLNTIEDG